MVVNYGWINMFKFLLELKILKITMKLLFIDKENTGKDILLMDASKLGEKKKVDGNQRTILSAEDIEQIISSFHACESVDDFCVKVTAEQIKEKNYSFSAGQYFDIKIEYVDITAEEFEKRIADYTQTLTEQFAESHRLEKQIIEQLSNLQLKK